MKMKHIALLAAFLIYSACGYSGQHRYGNAYGADLSVEVLDEAVITTEAIESQIFNLSENDALIATCSAILLIVGKTEAASWYATILDQKIITDFLFDVISAGLKDSDFSQEELEAASASCINVMEKSKAGA